MCIRDSSVSLIDRGPVVSADALAAALAGQIETRSRDEYVVAVAGVRVAVTPGVPFVRDGALYLPYSFVSDFLPRVATGVTFDSRRGILQRQITTPSPVPGKARSLTVVVDAGHGGPDRGMRGPIGASWEIREKDITLDVSLALRDALQARGVSVVMTRSTDTLIALSDRGRIANAKKGDVFLSIHVNAW